MKERAANTLKKNSSKWAIFSLINNTKLNNKQILGWRIIAGKKVTSELYIRVIRKFRNEFVVRGMTEKQKNTLNNFVASSGVLNFYLAEDMVLFQSEVKHIDPNGDFVFSIPQMIAQIDRRKHMRLFLSDEVRAKVVFFKENHGHRVMRQQFNKDCFDLSAGGLSFFISRAESKFFDLNDSVEDIELYFDNTSVKLKADIVNIFDVEPDERNQLHYKAKKVCLRYRELNERTYKKINDFVFKYSDLEEAI